MAEFTEKGELVEAFFEDGNELSVYATELEEIEGGGK